MRSAQLPVMRRPRRTAFCIGLLLLTGQQVVAQDAQQQLFYQVDASNRIAVAGTPSLPLNGSSRATWAITTNECGVKVTLNLNAPLPTGVTLLVGLAPPNGARSEGVRPLSTTGVDLVTGITRLYAGPLGVLYRLDAQPQAHVTPTSRTVTYTITGGA